MRPPQYFPGMNNPPAGPPPGHQHPNFKAFHPAQNSNMNMLQAGYLPSNGYNPNTVVQHGFQPQPYPQQSGLPVPPPLGYQHAPGTSLLTQGLAQGGIQPQPQPQPGPESHSQPQLGAPGFNSQGHYWVPPQPPQQLQGATCLGNAGGTQPIDIPWPTGQVHWSQLGPTSQAFGSASGSPWNLPESYHSQCSSGTGCLWRLSRC